MFENEVSGLAEGEGCNGVTRYKVLLVIPMFAHVVIAIFISATKLNKNMRDLQ